MKKDSKFDIDVSPKHGGMTDVMVDIETTGLNTQQNAIAQIGAVKFNAQTGQTGDKFVVNVDINAMPSRVWMPSTKAWWDKQDKRVREGVFEKPYAPKVALKAFASWCAPLNSLRFWCKGLHFDYPYIEGYFEELRVMNPFFYRNAVDMGSFIDGLYFPKARQTVVYKDVGDAHNALSDAINQLGLVQEHIRQARTL